MVGVGLELTQIIQDLTEAVSALRREVRQMEHRLSAIEELAEFFDFNDIHTVIDQAEFKLDVNDFDKTIIMKKMDKAKGSKGWMGNRTEVKVEP